MHDKHPVFLWLNDELSHPPYYENPLIAMISKMKIPKCMKKHQRSELSYQTKTIKCCTFLVRDYTSRTNMRLSLMQISSNKFTIIRDETYFVVPRAVLSLWNMWIFYDKLIDGNGKQVKFDRKYHKEIIKKKRWPDNTHVLACYHLYWLVNIEALYVLIRALTLNVVLEDPSPAVKFKLRK